MFYNTTAEHEELRAKIRTFAEEEVKPNAFIHDQDGTFPTEAVQQLGEMGLMGIPYSKEYGGAGLDVISYAIAVEELGRVDGSLSVILSAHTSLAGYPIDAFGTEEQKEKYLIPLSTGEKIGAFGLTEENAGSDAGGTETTAILDGDNYILNGEKIFITNAIEADIYIVFALTTENIGTRGMSAFIVEKDWEGFSFGEIYDKLGIRASKTAELRFSDVKVPKENLLAKEGDGFKIAMSTLDGGRIGIAAQALGIAQGAYESALEYAKEREQFGGAIAHQQVISFKIADMATKLRAARMLVYSAAELKQNGEKYSMEAAMAKQYASDVGVEIVHEALQVFGGNGYIKGMDVERAYRDIRITPIYEGTNEIQRIVIASHLIGKLAKVEHAGAKPKGPATGYRKKIIFKDGSPQEQVDALLEALKKDGYDFTVGIDIDTPIVKAERLVSVGQGIGEKENMVIIEELAKNAGAALSSSRPIAETLRYLPLNRYVGMSGQKFGGNLYIAVGISGAGQHLKGIKNASTIVAINNDPGAKIFKNADYGIVGDLNVIVPLLSEALDSGEAKAEAPPMTKMKRATAKKIAPTWDLYVCNGCGHEYDPAIGDDEGEIYPGTLFKDIPEEWTCPICGDDKDQYILS